MAETIEEAVRERRNLIMCRVITWGKTSAVITLPSALRQQAGVVVGDYVGFRIKTVNGRRFWIGERIPMNLLARIPAPEPDA